MQRRTSILLKYSACFALAASHAFVACSAAGPARLIDGTGGSATPQAGASGTGVMLPSSGAGGAGGTVGINIDAGAIGPCVNLECQQTTCTAGACTVPACAPGATTTVSGIVYEPAGKIPLYNVMVYVPNGQVQPFPPGAACDRCAVGALNPVVSALTDTSGRFVLDNVPVGANIPLVIQIGKWRRQVVLPAVTACADTPVDATLTHLPRTQAEGDIPLIAITTGGADSMECLPRRMGIADSEFTTEAGTGRIHLYSGQTGPNGDIPSTAFAPTLNAGATYTRSTVLWNDLTQLMKYDIVVLSCEGGTIEAEKPMPARDAMYQYASQGGRVLASHWHHIWFSGGPDPVPAVGTWQNRPEPPDPATGTIDQSFPKGAALAEWLVNVQASAVLGEIQINAPRDNVQTVDPMYARQWITTMNANANPQETVQYLSFNAPLTVPEEQKCGRAVFTDLHVSSTGADTPRLPFPTGCEDRDLSPEEKAVAFMLFDLSSCIQDDDFVPMPPQ